MSRKLFALLGCAAAAVAGCGSSTSSKSSSGSTSSTSKSKGATIAVTSGPAGPLPRPKEPLPAFEKRLTAVFADAASGKCAPVTAFKTSAGYSLPCTPGKTQSKFAGFKITATAQYGTGAVVEFTDAEVARARHNLDVAGATPTRRRPTGFLPLALGSSGAYTYIPAAAPPILAGSYVGTRPNGWSEADATAIRYLTAVRDVNCPTWFKYTATPNGMSRPQACKLGLTQAGAPLRQLLKTQRVKLSRMGGNAVFYFYRLQVGSTAGTIGIARDQPPAPSFITLGTARAPSG